MKNYHIKIICFLAFGLFGLSSTYAQYDDDYQDDSYTDEENYNYNDTDSYGDDTQDTSNATDGYSDDYSSDFGSSSSYGYEQPKQEPVFVRKKYERFVPPYDSIREMVSYTGTVTVVDNEDYEIEVDTIYARAKTWMVDEFGEKKLKKMTKLDGMNERASETEYKIVIRGSFPCIVEPNEFTKKQDGDIQFKMEVRFREGRYRYRINNLVHISPLIAGEKEAETTYFEYYMKSQDDVRGGDVILLAADKKINEMIDELRKTCQTNPLEEDDDW